MATFLHEYFIFFYQMTSAFWIGASASHFGFNDKRLTRLADMEDLYHRNAKDAKNI